jgi:hypothetical protein
MTGQAMGPPQCAGLSRSRHARCEDSGSSQRPLAFVSISRLRTSFM